MFRMIFKFSAISTISVEVYNELEIPHPHQIGHYIEEFGVRVTSSGILGFIFHSYAEEGFFVHKEETPIRRTLALLELVQDAGVPLVGTSEISKANMRSVFAQTLALSYELDFHLQNIKQILVESHNFPYWTQIILGAAQRETYPPVSLDRERIHITPAMGMTDVVYLSKVSKALNM